MIRSDVLGNESSENRNGRLLIAEEIVSTTSNSGLCVGEQNSEELAYCLLDPETRNIVQLTVNNIQETNDMFNDLYGKNVEPRVKFLLEHSEEAHID